MKAFIHSCRARGKGYYPSQGEAEDSSPALVPEVQLNGHKEIEESPLRTATLTKSSMLPMPH
jgi:hypothetical protein